MDKCKVCGCTDDNACDGGCWWVAKGLCSQCADKLVKENKKQRKIIEFHEKYNKEASEQIIKDEEIIKKLKSDLELKRGLVLAKQNIKLCEENKVLKEQRSKTIEYIKEYRFATVGFCMHADSLLNIIKED